MPITRQSLYVFDRTHSATGTELVIVRDPNALNDAVSVSVRAGMRDEKPGQEGMMHLLEHVIYQDSENFTAAEREATLHGGVLGGNTHMEYMEFYELSQTGSALAMVDRMLDQVFHPAVHAHQVAEQIQAVATERANRLAPAPGEVLPWPHLTQRAWLDHAHNHDGTGNVDLEGRATSETLRSLHEQYFHAANTVVCIVTSQDPDSIRDKAAALLEQHIPSRAPTYPVHTHAKSPSESSHITVQDSKQRFRHARTITVTQLPPDLPPAGPIIAAEALKTVPRLDASAGLFGPFDIAYDDLFVLVDDTSISIRPADRLRAVLSLTDQDLQRCVNQALFLIEKQVHDTGQLARTIARDTLLRSIPDFTHNAIDQLGGLLAAPYDTRGLITQTVDRLASQPAISTTIQTGIDL